MPGSGGRLADIIGVIMKTFIIAEAGSNHNGCLRTALDLIDAAVEAGCDAVKFQTFASDTLYSRFTPDFAGYKNIPSLMNKLEMPIHWLRTLKNHCDTSNIEFMSTPFDEAAVDALVELGVKRLKISGFEASDPRFVRYVARTKLPLIISISGDTLINRLIRVLSSVNASDDITFLHCNSAYPTPPEDCNLKTIEYLKEYGKKVGFSDHTVGHMAAFMSVAMGVSVIEKHFTLDRKMEGPDHKFAACPDRLKVLVSTVRRAEKLYGNISHTHTKSEKKFQFAKRSIVSRYGIKKGEVLYEHLLTTKRPCMQGQISATYWDTLFMGPHIATKDIPRDKPLTYEDIDDA